MITEPLEPIAEQSTTHCPYKGLEPYGEEDHDFFFGRGVDEKTIISNLYASPLTVLCGASGVGKSSLLMAGVIPRLRRESDATAVVFRDWQVPNPALALKEAILQQIAHQSSNGIELNLKLLLPEFLQSCNKALPGPIFLILDQFEEYFLLDSGTPQSFDGEFARAVNRKDIDVNFLLSMREEELGCLDRFCGRIPNILGNVLRLKHLSRKDAEVAIRGPLDVYNERAARGEHISIEDKLVGQLLNDARSTPLGKGADAAVEIRTSTAPIETWALQILLTRIWQSELENRSRELRLRTLQDILGGSRKVISTYLDETLNKLTPGERDVAARLFQFLVTPTGRKIAWSIPDLASPETTNLDEDVVTTIIQKFSTRSRSEVQILRKIAVTNEPDRYEIIHDILAQAARDWRGRYLQEQEEKKIKQKAAAEAAEREKEAAHQRELEQVRALAAEQAKRAEVQRQRVAEKAEAAKRMKSLAWLLFIATFAAIIFASFSLVRRNEALKAEHEALQAKDAASHAKRLAEEAKQQAENDAKRATIAETNAEYAAKVAGMERDKAQAAEKDANKQREDAEKAKQQAQEDRGHAREAAEMEAAQRLRANQLRKHADNLRMLSVAQRLAVQAGQAEADTGPLIAQLSFSVFSQAKLSLLSETTNTLSVSPALDNVNAAIDDALRRTLGRSFGQTIKPNAGPLGAVTVTKDSRILCAGRDGSLSLLSLTNSSNPSRVLAGWKSLPSVVYLSRDGSFFGRASNDLVRVWDVRNAPDATNFFAIRANNKIRSISISPNGIWLGVVFEKGTGGIASIRDRDRDFREFGGTGYNIYSLAFSPDNQLSVCGGTDGKVHMFKLSSPKVFIFDLPSSKFGEIDTLNIGSLCTAIAFNETGDKFAAGCVDGSVHIAQSTNVARMQAEPNSPTQTHSAQNNLRDLSQSNPRETAFKVVASANIGGPVSTLCFSPSGDQIAIGSWDDTIKLWNLQKVSPDGAPLEGHKLGVSGLVYSSSGTHLISASLDSCLRVWSITEKRSELSAAFPSTTVLPATKRFTAAAISSDGSMVACAEQDGTVKVATKEFSRSLPAAEPRFTALGISPDRRFLAGISISGQIGVFDFQQEKDWQVFPNVERNIISLCFGADSNTLAVATTAGHITVWDWKQQKPLSILTNDSAGIMCLSLCNDKIAVGSWDYSVSVWDWRNTNCLLQPKRFHEGAVSAVVFGPAAEKVLSAGTDGKLCMWNLAHPDEAPKKLAVSTAGVNSIAINGTAQLLAAGSLDGVVSIWRAEPDGTVWNSFENGKMRLIMSVRAHSDKVLALNFGSSDEIMSTDQLRTVLSWVGSTKELAQSVITRTGRHLSKQEREFLIGEPEVDY